MLPGVLICGLEEDPGGCADDSRFLSTHCSQGFSFAGLRKSLGVVLMTLSVLDAEVVWWLTLGTALSVLIDDICNSLLVDLLSSSLSSFLHQLTIIPLLN